MDVKMFHLTCFNYFSGEKKTYLLNLSLKVKMAEPNFSNELA